MFGQLRKQLKSSRHKEHAHANTLSVLPDPLAGRILTDSVGDSAAAAHTRDHQATSATTLTSRVADRIAKAQSVGIDPQACLEAVTFREPATLSAVIDSLRTFGLAIFPSLYDQDRLAKIDQEYQDLIANGTQFTQNVSAREDTPAHSYAITVMREALRADRFPETQALFGSPLVEEITRHVFAGQDFDFNHDLFIQWTDHTDTPASGALHWDKQLTLKSWLYVTDATEGFGAMRAGAGTAAWTRYIREDAMFDGIPYGQILNQVEEKDFPLVSTGGPAGTFFLFLSDTAHGATPVDQGKRRNIMRARSRPARIREWSAWAGKL